jgi:hypothetical protein
MVIDSSNGADVEEGCCGPTDVLLLLLYRYCYCSETEEHHDYLSNIANDPPDIRALILLRRSLELHRSAF